VLCAIFTGRYAKQYRNQLLKMLCEKCHWFENENPIKSCEFCMRIGFPEDILCYLARNNRKKELSECHAFRSKLSLVSSGQEQEIGVSEEADQQYLFTEKDKYLVALSKQKLTQSSDKVHFKLQYHMCFVTKNRKKLFLDTSDVLDECNNIFEAIGSLFKNTEIEILHLSPDHVHLYVNTIPDYAFDEIANKIKTQSEEKLAIILRSILSEEENIWETGYFSETIG